MITDGNSPYMDAVISAINKQGIPEYEIIVVGGPPIEGVRHIEFDDSTAEAGHGKLCHKKNLVAKNASYQNICLLHDYLELHHDWYAGFQKFGYNWQACTNKIKNLHGVRQLDWVVTMHDSWVDFGDDLPPPFETGCRLVSYDSSPIGRWQFYPGYYVCVKRDIMLETPLPEDRIQNKGEDILWSRQLYFRYGDQIFNFNRYSAVTFLKPKRILPWMLMGDIFSKDFKYE